ncbi:MAG: hypothetical protein EA402_04075 [Planctomycetota bacterium]|nr:MAG: hypothetical protein EA402_04075 [Planctomycetota bacterium]
MSSPFPAFLAACLSISSLLFLSACGSSSDSQTEAEKRLGFKASPQWPQAQEDGTLNQNDWFVVQPVEGQTWIYQAYAYGEQASNVDLSTVVVDDEASFAHSFGYHDDPALSVEVLYVLRSTVLASQWADPVWVDSETQGWLYCEAGGLYHIGESFGDGIFRYGNRGQFLPSSGPQLNQEWDLFVEQRPLAGGSQEEETVLSRRRLLTENVIVTTPAGNFSDAYRISIEEVVDTTVSVQRYEYWSPSHGGLIAVQEAPGDPLERWYRLARIADGPGWHTPFAVQEDNSEKIPAALHYVQ